MPSGKFQAKDGGQKEYVLMIQGRYPLTWHLTARVTLSSAWQRPKFLYGAIPSGKKFARRSPSSVRGELHVPALVRHPRDDEPEAGPVVEPVVHEAQLRRVVRHEHGRERGAETAVAGIEGCRGRHGD
jgi:hypothetical protein